MAGCGRSLRSRRHDDLSTGPSAITPAGQPGAWPLASQAIAGVGMLPNVSRLTLTSCSISSGAWLRMLSDRWHRSPTSRSLDWLHPPGPNRRIHICRLSSNGTQLQMLLCIQSRPGGLGSLQGNTGRAKADVGASINNSTGTH